MAAPRKLLAKIKHVSTFEGQITHYTLTTETNSRFKPGQFLHLAMDPYDPSFNWPESRVFSIANAPNELNEIEILISPKGKFTQRMVDELKVGSEVWIKLPFGVFNFDAAIGKNVVFLAGGTGISPFLSFLKSQLNNNLQFQSLSIYYGVRNPELIIFEQLLADCHQQIPNFSYEIFCENGETNSGRSIKKGFMPVDEIVDHTSSLNDVVYYLSGPKGMISAFENALFNKGIKPEQVIYDRWE